MNVIPCPCQDRSTFPSFSSYWSIHTDTDTDTDIDTVSSTSFVTADNNVTFGGILPRAFEDWNYGKIPCYPPDPNWRMSAVQRSPARHGLFYVKEMKTGGSTAAGINLRIARNEARRQFPSQYSICKSRSDHVLASKMEFNQRNRSKSFLWTVIREPTKRAISQFFHFEVSRNKVEPTDQNFLQWVNTTKLMYPYYLKTLSLYHGIYDLPNDQVAEANQIMLDYDFIGLTERMEESIVALQLLLGLTTGDVLYLNAKGSGGYDDGAYLNKGCVYIVPSFVSPGMKHFFESSSAWKELIRTDALLHQAANRSLDLTIERLGRERFHQALGRFQQALRHINDVCVSNITFPCNAAGQKLKASDSDCMWLDSGCGTTCLDKVADEWDLYSAAV